MLTPEFRKATPDDVEVAMQLIYSSGPKSIDYGFATNDTAALEFLRFAFIDGKGLLGWRNHTVVTRHAEIVGIAATYNLPNYLRMSLEHLAQVWQFFGAAKFSSVARKGLHLQSLMPPPGRGVHYLAHFGVREDLRGQGIGTALLDFERRQGLALGRRIYALDVAIENTAAQKLYVQYGFAVTGENSFSGPAGVLGATRRMTLPLTK